MPDFPIYERPIRLGPDTAWRPTFAAAVAGRRTRRLGAITAPEGSTLEARHLGGPLLLSVPLGLGRGRTVALEADDAHVAAQCGDYRLEFRAAYREGPTVPLDPASPIV